jgi:hypothetical protein
MFKVIVSRDKIFFLNSLKSKHIFCVEADGFHIFWLSFVKKTKIMFLLASMKSPTNCNRRRCTLYTVHWRNRP